jgi:polyphosphate kinase
VVGRYLEHSRIFAFRRSDRPPRYFIGSADLTPSNLDRRVQLLCPVEDHALAARLEEILSVNLSDTGGAWSLGSDGRWKSPRADAEGDADARFAQLELQRLARLRRP